MKIREIIAEDQQVDEFLGALAKSKLIQKAAAPAASSIPRKLQDAGTIMQAFANLGTGFAKLISRLGMVYVIGKTYFNIKALNKKYEAKQISPADYEQQLQAELGFAASQLAAAGLVKMLVAGGGAIIGTIPLLGWLGRLVRWGSGPAGAGFMVWLQSPAGQEAFSKWFVGAIMEEGFAGGVIDFISSYTKKAYDAIMMRTKDAEKNSGTKEPAADGAASTGDDNVFDKISAEKPAASQEFDPATGTWLNKP